jgi:ATP-grasp domain
VDLFEYQAKELFAEYGVPVQAGKVARTAEEARAAAAEFAAEGHPLVVVKAQVKTSGRGKAGGVKLADGPDEAFAKASQILGMDIKGHTVHSVLIAEAVDIAAEYYLSFLLDRANRTFLAICSVHGGIEIEEVAHTSPEAVARIPVSPLTGVDRDKAAEIIAAGRIPLEAADGAALLAERLWAMFTDEDATLVEVNPMALTGDGQVLAVDAKVTLEDNASFRQEHARFADDSDTDPIEARAKAKHLNYVKLDDQVGMDPDGTIKLPDFPFCGIVPPYVKQMMIGSTLKRVFHPGAVVFTDAVVWIYPPMRSRLTDAAQTLALGSIDLTSNLPKDLRHSTDLAMHRSDNTVDGVPLENTIRSETCLFPEVSGSLVLVDQAVQDRFSADEDSCS